MHTRSHLILQDLDLLRAFGDRLRVGVSITTDDDQVRREFEPQAPSIFRRLELIRKLSEAGVRVHASICPLLPCNPERLIRLLKPFVRYIWIDQMHYQEVNTKPILLTNYASFFEGANYAETVAQIAAAFSNMRDIPLSTAPPKPQAATTGKVPAQPQQLSLKLF